MLKKVCLDRVWSNYVVVLCIACVYIKDEQHSETARIKLIKMLLWVILFSNLIFLMLRIRFKQWRISGCYWQRHNQLYHRRPWTRTQLQLLHRGLYADGSQSYVRPSQSTYLGGWWEQCAETLSIHYFLGSQAKIQAENVHGTVLLCVLLAN